jgi:hypothetical protein
VSARSKRTVLILAGSLLAVAAGFGYVVGLPLLRPAFEVYRHVQKAASREPAALEAWTEAFGDPEKTLTAFPGQHDNAEAVRLIELARTLRIDVAAQRGERHRVIEPTSHRALNEAFARYCGSELTRSSGTIGAPGETARVVLDSCRAEVDSVVDFLRTCGPITWETDTSLGNGAPYPNLAGLMRLQRLLVAEALNSQRLGRHREAEAALEASWALNKSLRDRPDIPSQLVATAVARMQVGLLRRLEADPALWRATLVDHDYRASLLTAMVVESAAALRNLPPGSSSWNRAARTDFLDSRGAFLLSIRHSRISDGSGLEPPSGATLEGTPFSVGLVVHMVAVPNLEMAVKRAERLHVDRELTLLILAARESRQRLGWWPASLPSTESAVAGGTWLYSVDPEGKMTIAFSRKLDWGEQMGLVLPARYSSD